MPGIWLISALFFLSAVLWGVDILFIGVPAFIFLAFLLLRRSLFSKAGLVVFSAIIWAGFGSFISYNIVSSPAEVIPPKTVFTVHGIVRTLDIGNRQKALVDGQYIEIGGKRVAFPFSFWVINRSPSGWSDAVVGSQIGMNVYFTGKSFVFIPSTVSATPVLIGRLYYFLYRLRHMAYVLARNLSLDARSIISAVLFGIKDGSFYQLRRAFNAVGAGHILAISGLHLMILTGLVFTFMRIISTPYPLASAIVAAFIIFYIFLIPESPSLLRAGIMFLVYLLSVALKRKWSLYDVLGITVFIIFFISPQQVFSIGFQLSFTAVLSILLGFSLKKDRGILDIWFVSLAVSLGIAPLIIKYFHCFPLISWLVAPLFILLLTITLILGMIYFLSFGIIGAKGINLVAFLMVKAAKILAPRALPLCYDQINDNLIYAYYFLLMILIFILGVIEYRKEEML